MGQIYAVEEIWRIIIRSMSSGRGFSRGRAGRGRGRGRGQGRGPTSEGVAWKSPSILAADLEEGEVRMGLDGQSQWKVVSIRSNGNHSWRRIFPKPFTSKAGIARVDPEKIFSKGQNAEDILKAAFGDEQDLVEDDVEQKSVTPFVLGKTRNNLPKQQRQSEAASSSASSSASPSAGGWPTQPSYGAYGAYGHALPKMDIPDPYRFGSPLSSKEGSPFSSKEGVTPTAKPKAKTAAKKNLRDTGGLGVMGGMGGGMCAMDVEEEPPLNTHGQKKNSNVGFRWNSYNDPNNIFASQS